MPTTPTARRATASGLVALAVALAHAGTPARAEDPSPETKALLTKLREDTKSKTAATRVTAYKALGEFGEKAKGQRRVLCEGMLDPAPMVRAAAADALKKVDEPLHKLALGIVIDRNIKDVTAAGKLGDAGEPLAPLLLGYATSLAPAASSANTAKTYEDARGALRSCVVAMVAVAPTDEGVNRAVIGLLGNPHPALRALALDHVAALKNQKLALPGVIAIASNQAERVPSRTRAILLAPDLVDENTTPGARKALEALKFDKQQVVREAVAKALDTLK